MVSRCAAQALDLLLHLGDVRGRLRGRDLRDLQDVVGRAAQALADALRDRAAFRLRLLELRFAAHARLARLGKGGLGGPQRLVRLGQRRLAFGKPVRRLLPRLLGLGNRVEQRLRCCSISPGRADRRPFCCSAACWRSES